MKEEITREFNGAKEKGLKVFYDETLGNFDIETEDESFSFYDDGEAVKKVKNFIEEY